MKFRKNIIYIVLIIILCFFTMCSCNIGDDFRNPINGEPEAGTFYSLQEAFDNGWLSRGDLRNIANYYNNPNNLYPYELDDEIVEKLKEAKAEHLRNNEFFIDFNIKAEDFKVLSYYGSYNNLIVILMNLPYVDVPDVIIDYWETIGGVKFHHKGHYSIEVCRI